jgi:hypothetical protein
MTRYFQLIKPAERLSGLVLALVLVTAPGCRKYLEVPLPVNSISAATIFTNENTAAGAVNNIYTRLFSLGLFDGTTSVNWYLGLYGDELKSHLNSPYFQPIYADAVNSSTSVANYWSTFYSLLYAVNLAIEGLTPATNLNHQSQWLGEAYFLRGLLYFYQTNLYGDAALVLGSDYLANNGLARSPQADVYQQILADLKRAQSLLDSKYHDGAGSVTTGRGRPNKAAATALLARVYLYIKDWKNAEAQADGLIANTADYQLGALSKVFLVNSTEVIWGLIPFQLSFNSYLVKDTKAYILPAGNTPGAGNIIATLADSLVAAFEPGDGRYANWVGIDSVKASGSTPAAVYYYAYKYKANGTYTTAQEILAMLRLGEQYLIRAEARAQQNNLSGALADLNAVRARAGLPPSTASSQADVLAAILRERRVELFTEVGHRFFDLRRTGNLDAVMNVMAPLKGGAWASFKAWWPIPVSDIQSNPHLVQTPGYQ